MRLKDVCVYGNMGIWDILDRRQEGILLQPVVKVLEVGSRFVK